MPDVVEAICPIPCPGCGTELAHSLLTCPSCHRLVHADELKRLAAEAEQAEKAGELSAALGSWRSALELLPAASRQHQTIAARVAEVGRRLDEIPGGSKMKAAAAADAQGHSKLGGSAGAGAAGLGGLALLLWKFKFVAIMVLTKGKLLLLGLTKAGTFYSMLLSFWVYWVAFGWWFALGLVVSIYIHEMGHVFALRHYGIKASAPMFIPGLGAFVRLKQSPLDPRQDARVGLAGPIWGLGAALAAGAVWLAAGTQAWGAIARVGALINLFNLIPFPPLDGSRAFRALSRTDRWLATATLAMMAYATGQTWVFLLVAVAAWNAAFVPAPSKSDRTSLLWYELLVVSLASMSMIPVKLRF
ncbi:MAG TPA: site-2 protease family protein [Isosphaeraceae bacterium]|jgi:Zn-dependent protease|nr:site-2 protease family protein [Isosphaeraceae bacterium]